VYRRRMGKSQHCYSFKLRRNELKVLVENYKAGNL
jgi:hypothetical protein